MSDSDTKTACEAEAKLPLSVVPGGRGSCALEERSDDELMTLCKAGYQHALRVLLERHESRIFGFACKYLGDSALAEEVSHETFIKLWSLRESYVGRGLFKAFLSRLALNVCRDLARRRTRKARAGARLVAREAPPATEGLEEALLRREEEHRIQRAVANLPSRFKEVILMRFYLGLDYNEMQDALGRSEGTLRSRVFYALRKLREALREGRP